MGATVRPAVLKDAASLRRCWDICAKEHKYAVELEAPPLSEVKAILRDSVRDKTPFLVAVDGTRVVGMASVFGNGVPSLKHCGDIGMTLLPEYREMGLGTKLLEGLIKKSRGKYETLVLWVFKKNKRARNLYKKMGFEPRGAVKRGVKLPSGFDDTLLMQMPLRGGRTT